MMGLVEYRVVYRSRFRTNPIPLALFCSVVAVSLCLGILIPVGIDALQPESRITVIGFVLYSPLGLLLGLAAVGIAYLGAFLWSDTLIFAENYLQRRSIPFPLVERMTIHYDEIVRIRNSMRGVIVIETVRGKSMPVRVDGYEGGALSLLQELERRVSKQRFSEQIASRLQERTKADRWSIALSSIAVTFFLGAMGWSSFQDRGRAGIAWEVEARMPFGRAIEDFTIGADGAVWLLIREGFQLDQTEDYEVIRFDGKGEQKIWTLPERAALLHPEPNRYTYPSDLLVDDNDRPWLNFRFTDQILFWNEDRWEWIKVPEEGGQGYIENITRSDGAFWGDRNERLVVVEASEMAAWIVPGFFQDSMPEIQLFEAPTAGLILARFTTGSMLMSRLTLASGGLEWIEVPAQDEWEPNGSGLPMLTTSLWDIVYILSGAESKCLDGMRTVQVGKFISSERGWTWRELLISNDCSEHLEVTGFLVDSQERVWISTSGEVRVFSGLNFNDRAEKALAESVQYTETNSGYFAGELRQDRGGRIWSLDENGKFLVRMDGSSQTQPKPLPQSVAALLGSEWIPMILQYIGIFSILGIFFVVWEANRFKKGNA